MQILYFKSAIIIIMIFIEVREEDLLELTLTEVKNLPGALFAGSSPLLRPFMKRLEAVLPEANRGRGDSYVLSCLRSHIESVHADENMILARSGDVEGVIHREELSELLMERYPTTGHERLNLPGLLFLQSGPALQTACSILLRRLHGLSIPDGRRSMRYVFHIGVSSIDADRERIVICFEPERLPRRADGSSVLR